MAGSDAGGSERSVAGDGFRQLIENSVQGVLVHHGFAPLYVNGALARMFGFESAEEVLALPDLRVLLAPEERERVTEYHERRIAGEAVPERYELRCLRQDGSAFWVELIGSAVVWDGLPCIQGSLLDVTERHSAQEQLRVNQRLLRTVIDNLPLFVFVKDLQSNYVMVNRTMTEFYELPREEFPNTTPLSLPIASQEEKEMILSDDRVVFETLQPYIQPVVRVTMPDGTETYRHSLKIPLFDDEGEVIGLLGVGQDITERLRLERELARYQMDLEAQVEKRTRELRAAEAEAHRNERLAALGQLTGSVSHELRNPIGTISASIGLIRARSDGSGDARMEALLERAERNVARCVRLLDNLLSFSRMGELALASTTIDEWLLETLEDEPIPDEVEIQVDLGADAVLEIDPERMRQAVSNVLRNACQAMVERETRGETRLRVVTRIVGAELSIRISDTGPGIPPDAWDRIFEPLFSTRSFGFGLGLPLVKRIAERHGGRVELESVVDEGTSVEIRVPTTRGEEDGA